MDFLPDKVYLVQNDHVLSVEFIDATTVAPQVKIKGANNDSTSLAKLDRVDYPDL